jgi:hypothetical protein
MCFETIQWQAIATPHNQASHITPAQASLSLSSKKGSPQLPHSFRDPNLCTPRPCNRILLGQVRHVYVGLALKRQSLQHIRHPTPKHLIGTLAKTDANWKKMQDTHGNSVVIDPNPKPLHNPRTATNLKLYSPTQRTETSLFHSLTRKLINVQHLQNNELPHVSLPRSRFTLPAINADQFHMNKVTTSLMPRRRNGTLVVNPNGRHEKRIPRA